MNHYLSTESVPRLESHLPYVYQGIISASPSWLIDRLMFNLNFSNISAISWRSPSWYPGTIKIHMGFEVKHLGVRVMVFNVTFNNI